MVTSDVDIIIIMILELEYCQVLAIQTGGVTIAALMCCNNEVLTKPEMEIDKSFFLLGQLDGYWLLAFCFQGCS